VVVVNRIHHISARAAARGIGMIGALAFCGLLLAVARQAV